MRFASSCRGESIDRSSPSERRMMVPWLFDPNTGAELFESQEIIRYLHEEYSEPDPGAGS